MSKDITKTALYKATNTRLNLFMSIINRTSLADSPYRLQFAKFLSVMFVAMTVFLLFTIYETNTTDSRASTANIGLVASMGLFLVTILLNLTHGDAYWFMRTGGAKRIDERQKLVRQRVFHVSYLILGVLLILLIPFLPYLAKQFSPFVLTTGRLEIPMVPIAFFIYGLPSAVASWFKDA